ncbi:MAG: sacsin N-terminal ATP-binding-like domain-containing protein, partial [Candidatus Thorarchaeota archaeon]
MSDKRTKTGTKKKSSPKRVKEVAYKKTENVVCTKCGKNPIDSKVLPPGQQWICHECDTTLETYREFLSWIRLRIKALSSEGEFIGKMVVRELVQNADDAKDLDGFGAKRIVFRFQDDALYVANDGRAFTLEDEGDFDRIRRVLGEHKRKEEGVTGQHGSGFWTVYAITNTPEVHSTGWSKRFNPGKKEWEHYNPGSEGYRTSPYIE